jgi:hypothetical protein
MNQLTSPNAIAEPLESEMCDDFDRFSSGNNNNSVAVPSDNRLSAKLVRTFADRGCQRDGSPRPYSRISRLGFPEINLLFAYLLYAIDVFYVDYVQSP